MTQDTGRAAQLLHAAFTHEAAGRTAEARASAEQALQGFTDAGDSTGSAACHHLLGMLAAKASDPAGADAHLEAAIALRVQTGDHEGIASLHQQRFALAVQLGDIDRARAASEASLDVWRQAGDRDGEAQAVHQLAQFCLQAGELDRAQELLERGMWLSDRAGEERARGAMVMMLAHVDAARGHRERALRRADEGIDLARQAKNRQALIEALHQVGSLKATLGDLAGARKLLEESLDGRELLRDLEGRAATLQELAAIEQAMGRTSEALGRLAYAARTFKELENPGAEATALHAACTLAEEAEQVDKAISFGRKLIAVCTRIGDREAEAAARFAQATRLAAKGELDHAGEHYRRAAQLHGEAGVYHNQAVSQGMLGQVLAAQGRKQEALALLDEATERLRELGEPDAAATLAAIGAEIDAS